MMLKRIPLICFLLVTTLAFTISCNTTGTRNGIDSYIDTSQYINYPLAIEVVAYNSSTNATYDNTECRITTYDIDDNLIDVVLPIQPRKSSVKYKPRMKSTGLLSFIFNVDGGKVVDEAMTGRLITNDQGRMNYLLTLGDKYQAENTYRVRVECNDACVYRTFDVLPPTQTNTVYNWMLAIRENANWTTYAAAMIMIGILIFTSVFTPAWRLK